MQLQQTVGTGRQKLSLAYGNIPGQAPQMRRSPNLSPRELRRIVADLID